MPLWEIDDEFRMIRPQYPAMPTGVGFCMGMNLKAIQEVGLLDEENFGKGYGEENDWCQRAIAAGYENVHVDNLFVYHKHGGSFPSEEKQRLLKSTVRRCSASIGLQQGYCGLLQKRPASSGKTLRGNEASQQEAGCAYHCGL